MSARLRPLCGRTTGGQLEILTISGRRAIDASSGYGRPVSGLMPSG